MSERPIEKVLTALEAPKRSGDGWKARCPAHDDRNPSLSISEDSDGKVLLNCHAGCTFEEVTGALGLESRDLYPANSSTNGRRKIVATYPYTDEGGDLLFQVVRKQGKQFRQRQPDGSGGWTWNLKGVRRVLYRLPAVLEASSEGRVVFVAEGEKDVATLEEWGLTATCNPQGANSWRKEYSEALEGAHVVILPDNDEEGKKHARKVARSVFPYARSVRIVALPGLPEGGDVSDWKAAGGTAEELGQLANETPPREAPPEAEAEEEKEEAEAQPPPDYVPFPVDALPAEAADYVRAGAKAIGCAPGMVAPHVLAAMSAAVGSSARLRLKRSWREPATIWTSLVAPSGGAKTPALKHALRPVYRREREAKEDYEEELQAYEKAKKKGEAAQEPKRSRYRTGDATPESMMRLLGENPRGLLLVRNELGAWYGSFDRYAQGAADMQFWIEVWDGQQASRDRVTENVTVDRPAVSVTGTIQPGTLKEKLTELHFESGFVARFLLCMPPTEALQWTEADVTKEVEDAFKQLLDGLYSVPMGTEVELTPEAKKLWVRFYNRAHKEADELKGPAKAAYIKGVNYGARLALILHLAEVQKVQSESGVLELVEPIAPISGEVMRRALLLARWLRDETLRVYEVLGLAEEALSPKQRFLRKLPDKFKTAEAEALAEDFDVTTRTIRNWLSELVEQGDLEKVRRGLYRNTYSASSFRCFRNLHKENTGNGSSVKKAEVKEKGNVGNEPEPRDSMSTLRNNGYSEDFTEAVLEAPTVRWAYTPITSAWLAKCEG